MKRLAIMLLFSVLPALAADNSVSGTWKVEGNVSGYAVDRLCTFKQDGNKLTGSCHNGDSNAPDEKPTPFTGDVKDKTVTWKYDVDWNGSTLTATYTGAWDGDSAMTGAIDVQPVNAAGTFTAKKNK
ncbi:MAG: hypothetical protein WB421_08710 [Terriglobales bacterium]